MSTSRTGKHHLSGPVHLLKILQTGAMRIPEYSKKKTRKNRTRDLDPTSYTGHSALFEFT